MGLTAINPVRYGQLLAKTQPKVIESEREFESMVAQLEALDFASQPLTPEERALQELLCKLIEDYDSRKHPLPHLAPRKLLLFLMEQRELRQRDLIPVFGSSSVVSSVINGKREISKAHARKLAGFFGVSTELFI
jgi:HTH-type transcriptional regulator/antitoxin HigA